jgi:methylenetetrahydrofolate reductase (NADPH)
MKEVFACDASIIKLILYWCGRISRKHLESPHWFRFKRLKRKVDAGADYVVTQMFWQCKIFWVAKAREMGITVPIIPGIKPLAVQRHLQILPQIFRIDLPVWSMHWTNAKNADVKQVGIEWAIQQSLELKAAGVLHYYSIRENQRILDKS